MNTKQTITKEFIEFLQKNEGKKIFFKNEAPDLGNIDGVWSAREDQYSSFGVKIDCVILSSDVEGEGD